MERKKMRGSGRVSPKGWGSSHCASWVQDCKKYVVRKTQKKSQYRCRILREQSGCWRCQCRAGYWKGRTFTLSGRCICTVIYYQAMMKLKNDCYHFCRNHGVNFKNHITYRVHVKIRNYRVLTVEGMSEMIFVWTEAKQIFLRTKCTVSWRIFVHIQSVR